VKSSSWEKSLIKIARVFFVMVLVVGGSSLIYWEVATMAQVKKVEGKDLAWLGWQELEKPAEVAQAGEIEEETTVVKSVVKGADARPEIVRRYLKKYKSPLLDYADMVVELSDRYGFEYYWMVAIAQQESNLCKKIPEDSHNCWGYGIHSRGTLRFDNYELALNSYAQYLKEQYFDRGLNTAELIMKKYCPNSNGSWAFGVNKFIGELSSGNF
jgi:hypothetical protein